MKNLAVTQRASRFLESCGIQNLNSNNSNILHAVNSINDDFYLLLNNKIYKIPSDYKKDVISFDIDENLEFINLEYCSISQELYGACKSGDIMRISVEFEFECELIIQLNVDLQCMKLSPDHEIITLVTVNDVMITMVSTFQIIAEIDLHAPDFGQKQFVTVGWGKKETQFHGSEGKKAALAKPIEQYGNDMDDGLCRITWREDGSLFAVGFLHRENKMRQFKVFNREGILLYTSEQINSLEEPLSWKSSGSLIATTQNLSNKYVVALFEKNGLKHREFVLPYKAKEMRVKDLFWSPDSEILTIWCQMQEDSSSVLQLWSENNYHWYLKQSIKFPMDNSLICATWSTASCFKKLILLTHKEFIVYDYNWSVHHSRGKSVNDKSVVSVIDGNKLLVTGFRIGIVPPPMAHQTLETSECINAIAFAPDVKNEGTWINSNTFFCVSDSNKLIFYKHKTDSCLLEYEYIGSYNIRWNTTTDCEHENCLYNMHHFLWVDEHKILCSLSVNNQSFLCILTLDAINDQAQGQITVKQMHVMEGLIQHIIPSPDPKEAYIIVENSVVRYKEAEIVPTDIQSQGYIYKAEVVKIGVKHVLLSLYHRNCFSINGKQIANNITSFFVHSEFLLLTTVQHTLICVNLNEDDFEKLTNQNLTIKPWENKKLDETSSTNLNIRRLERGSQLIVSIPKDSRTILQMPRGNLECIQPRALSLYIIGFYLNNCDYLLAFDLMRRQRINLNLMYDHDPKKFIENADKFVEQVSKPSWLSLLLSELSEEDVTTTIYVDYYRRQPKSDAVSIDKIELVCDLLRKIMEERNDNNRLIQPILISLVKNKNKQGIEGALTKINEIRKLRNSAKNEESFTSDEALKYLLYIVDVNVLFDIALGMYDFDLTMFIASKSQKDPKEYIPFLNNLKKLDDNYMKYSIDLHLKRYDSALKHISKELNKFNECINLIRNHDLYTKALKLFDKNTEQYKEVARMYGEFLLKKRQYQEAGVMFYRSGDFKEALSAYMLAGSWQDVIILSAQMDLSETGKHKIYKDMVEHLNTNKKYEEAAYILATYLKDPTEAVIALCNGRCWKDAIKIAYDTQNLDLIESHVKSSVYEYANHSMYQIQKNKQDFEQYRSRLSVVRNNISQRNIKPYNEIISDNESVYNNKGISDILSDTSSVSGSTLSQKSKLSTLSGRSYRSSKNRRKQERKFLSLKEGSVFEDLALIQALYQIVSNTYKERDELHAVIQMLVYFGDDEYAEKVQNSMEQFLVSIDKSKSEIWNKSAPSSLTEMENMELTTSTEVQGLSVCQKLIEPYVLRPPVPGTLSWKLNIF